MVQEYIDVLYSNCQMSEMVTFTPESFKKFKEAYEDAVKNGHITFMFDSREYVTDYVKYLVEYVISFK